MRARIMPARPMKYRLAQLGVVLVAMAFLGYWALLVYCDVWRPIPLGLFLSFDGDRVIVVDDRSRRTRSAGRSSRRRSHCRFRWPSNR